MKGVSMEGHAFVFLFNKKATWDQTFAVCLVHHSKRGAFNIALERLRTEKKQWWSEEGFDLQCEYHSFDPTTVTDAWEE